MKLIMESWRKFLSEEDTRYDENGNVLPDLPDRHTTAIEEAGFTLIKYLGMGKMGVVYEVEDKETKQRLAAKVVGRHLPQYYSERKNYNWIIKNRDKLPDDVKEYVVDVYNLFEDSSGKHLIIFMELLQPAPKNVVNQIFSSTATLKGEYSPEKEERLLKDENAVYEIILDVLKKNSILRAERRYMGIREESMQEAAKRALRTYLVNKIVPKNTVPQVYTMVDVYDDSPGKQSFLTGKPLPKTPRSPQWRNLFNAILNEMEELIIQTRFEEDKEEKRRQAGGRSRGHGVVDADVSADAIRTHLHTMGNKGGGIAVFWSAASALEGDLTYYVNKKQVIPMTYGMPKDRPLGGSGPGVQGAFPEIEGILNAMKHLTQMGFNPRDMHTENIMMRADTNQLVMTDVGLFLVTKG